MSLFQCENCGSRENTALSHQGCQGLLSSYDWTNLEARKGMKLCSACAPSLHSDGDPTGLGFWHGKFERIFLPMGMFKTSREGNLEHIELGNVVLSEFQLDKPEVKYEDGFYLLITDLEPDPVLVHGYHCSDLGGEFVYGFNTHDGGNLVKASDLDVDTIVQKVKIVIE